MAFGIASSVAPEQGLYTAIIAGFIISVFGGSKVQIGGPTGAFIVIVASIVAQYGYGALAVATIMAGIFLIAMGLSKMGNAIRYIPRPVVIGFTNGIAVLINVNPDKGFPRAKNRPPSPRTSFQNLSQSGKISIPQTGIRCSLE